MLSVLFKFFSFCFSLFYLSLGTGKETEETNLLQHLSDACLVVCSRELTSYEQIFEGAGMSNFLLCYDYAFFIKEITSYVLYFELYFCHIIRIG